MQVPLEVMLPLGIIANELLTNCMKYAFTDAGGVITIELHHKDGRYRFLYSDDGIGVKEPQQLLKGNSLGIKLVHLAAKQLHGTVSLSSPKGLMYEIEFKDGQH